MEPTPRPGAPLRSSSEEVDLGQLLKSTGGLLSRIMTSLRSFIRKIGDVVVGVLLFIRRNLLWLIIGWLLGISYGCYQVYKFGNQFTADLTVLANFNSSRSLYGTIDYFTALITNSQTVELAKALKISPEEAAALRGIEANPIKSEIIVSQIYQEQFINNNLGLRPRMDTFWSKTINYQDFKSALTRYDFPVQEITVTSTDAGIFPKIQQGLINKISENRLLQATRIETESANRQTIDLLTASIRHLDTLTLFYNRRLSNTSETTDSRGNNVTLLNGNPTPRFPELEVYNKMLEVSDELKSARNKYVTESDIIQVYSPFPFVGHREAFFKQSVVRFGLNGLLAALLLLVAIRFYKSLSRLEKERNSSGLNQR